MSRFSLEVPIDALAQAQRAAPYADRLEVCEDLSSEGWSPSAELLKSVVAAVVEHSSEVVALVRPRPQNGSTGLEAENFLASTPVIDASLQTIEDAAQAGADAVAIGLLLPDGRIDVESCRILQHAATNFGLNVSFLRMFDLVPDRAEAIRTITELGMRRILTAGTRGWSTDGASIDDRVRLLQSDVTAAEHAARSMQGEPVEIVAAGGVRSSNATAFMSATPHLHSSCRIDQGPDLGELSSLSSLKQK